MVSLNSLLATINGAWLLNVLRSEAISVWFQPIVEIEDPTRIFAYECLCRGVSETGELVLPEKMFRTARDADLLFNLDRLCRLSAVRSASLHKIETNIFINFNPQAIYDPTYCLQTTCRAIDDLGMIPERIVFEVVESDRITDIEHLSGILNYYRNNGYRVAMDDVGAGYSSLNLLSKLKPDFIKIDKELIREVDIDDYKATITRAMIRLAKDLGIQVIAEGVERQSEWAWVKENAADFAQGNFFYRPADHPLGVGLQRGT
jgi:EAL domain-containing protein (putative c-di-GMP-specific phosphodiesterase class I)